MSILPVSANRDLNTNSAKNAKACTELRTSRVMIVCGQILVELSNVNFAKKVFSLQTKSVGRSIF